MDPENYLTDLIDMIYDFNLEGAIDLSNRLHIGEVNGVRISERENKLWSVLTSMIEEKG